MADTLRELALELLDDYEAAELWIRDEVGTSHSAHIFHEWVAGKRAEIEHLAAEDESLLKGYWVRIEGRDGRMWFAHGQVLTDEEYTAMQAKGTF